MFDWKKEKAGRYTADDGAIVVERDGSRWTVMVNGEAWGNWQRDFHGRLYEPFESLAEAQVILDEHRCRGLV